MVWAWLKLVSMISTYNLQDQLLRKNMFGVNGKGLSTGLKNQNHIYTA
jgi:hypothetical protein